jgi:hypothetical protein
MQMNIDANHERLQQGGLPNECLQPTRLTSAVSCGSRRCLLPAASIVPLSAVRWSAEAERCT